jgi:uncharacterized protein YdeI (BOF family)
MKRIAVFATLALFAGLFAYAQQSQPSQPPAPTAQSGATQARSPETSAKASKVFTGTITQDKDGYVLQTGDQKYKLDDQSKAKAYEGKQVKVQGSLNRDSNVIRVEKIEEAPSM